MLCGKCKKPLLCKNCGETEYSPCVDAEHDFTPDEFMIPDNCQCKRFRPEDCQECSKIKEYVGKDAMWYIKSTIEAIMILIGCICLIGFVVGMIFVIIAIPMVWGEPLGYQPFPWLNHVMAWSICVGLVDLLFLFSFDSDWRDEYEHYQSMIFNIKEKRP